MFRRHWKAVGSLVVTIEFEQAESRGWLESQVVSWAAGRRLVHYFKVINDSSQIFVFLIAGSLEMTN